MKKYLLAFFLLLLLGSCVFTGPMIRGEGEVTSSIRNIQGFDKVSVSRGLEVILVPDSREYLIVEADENLHSVIRTGKEGKVLEIYTDKYIRSARSKKIHVHFTRLAEIHSSSGSRVNAVAPIQSDTLSVSASSGSMQFLEIEAREFNGNSSSGAQLKLKGTTLNTFVKSSAGAMTELEGIASNAVMKASAGAQIRGTAFLTDSCRAEASSGAQIRVNVKSVLRAEASSGGQIRYSGAPAYTDLNSSSGGSVRPY